MKFSLDHKIILNISSNKNVYLQGQSIYNKNLITEFSCTQVNGVTVVKSKVDGNIVTIKFELNGKFISQICNCKSSSIWRGACEHVIATLFFLLEEVKKNIIIKENSHISKKLMDSYKIDFYNNIQTTYNSEIVSLYPELTIEDKDVSLFLSIGIKRKYVIKSIDTLLENVRDKKIVTYGKELELNHDFNSFDEMSQKLIRFIQKEYYNYKKYFDSYSFKEEENVRCLKLSPIGLDDIFKMYNYENLTLTINKKSSEVFILNDKIDFDIEFEKLNEEIILKINTLPIHILDGEEHDYFILDLMIYIVDKDLSEFIKPMIYAIKESSKNEIVLKDEEIYFFQYIIIPKLVKYELINNQEDVFNDICDKIITRFYFDIKSNKVICTLGFLFENEIHLYNTTSENQILQNIKNFVGKALIKYDFIEKSDGAFELSSKDLVYNFYKKGLDELKNIGEIYSTNKFEQQSYIPKEANINFDVRLTTNLLEISINSPDYTTEELIETLKNYNNQGFFKLKSGKYLNLADKNIINARELFRQIDFDKDDVVDNKIFLQKYKAFQIDKIISENKGLKITTESDYTKLIHDIQNFVTLELEIPETLKAVLRDYQIKGFKWLKTLSFYGFGGILADDMGLGKTIQVITLLLSNKLEGNKKPSIVVCPTSLIFNWSKEIEKFAENLNALIITGSADKRKKLLENKEVDVFITTYDTLKRDIENYENVDFKYIIADEAQNIKNPQTQNAKAIKKLKSENNFALTGTPIENSLDELWSIFDFIMPGYLFGFSKFTKIYNKPIIKDGNITAKENLKKQIRPFILRRNKKEVLTELPDKIETVQFAQMTEEQEKLYNGFLLEARGEINEIGKNNATGQMKVLTLITRLRQICCDPSMFLDSYNGGSGKLETTIELLQQSIESGHRILLFSQFTSMLSILKKSLDKRKINYFYLDGSVSSKRRIEIVEKFNTGEKEIFLISLKAGGAGLNLTGADVVIHYDPWWNYAVMAQATDRAHRIGQEKVVQVINIVAKNSIEERILKLQEKKQDLIGSILEDNTTFINKMTYDDILELFEM